MNSHPSNGTRRLLGRVTVMVRVAARNLIREVRRSLLTASAMILGLALLILSRSLADGAHEDWIETGVRLSTGHLAVQAPEYLETRGFSHRLGPDEVRAARDALNRHSGTLGITSVAPRLSVQGLASSASSALPVLIEGVDPEMEASFSLLAERVSEGRYLESGDELVAYVGEGLLRRLGLRIGSRFVVTAQAADGEIQGQLLRVVGTFSFGVPEMDEGVIHIPLDVAERWLGAPGDATTLAVLLGNSRDVPRAIRTLREELGTDAIRVLSWREASPELDSAVRMDDYGDYLFHTVLFAIVALAILNAVLMAVLNRKREFAVLRALGLSGAETGLLVLTEGTLVTLLSGIVGTILGLAVTWGFFGDGLDLSVFMDGDFTFSGIVMDPVMVPAFRVAHLLQSLGFTLAIGVLASIYPAVHASRLDVADSLKFEA
jgi:ABC-type lipoprotein release transport system permease subunit